jgi:hypothetical protein
MATAYGDSAQPTASWPVAKRIFYGTSAATRSRRYHPKRRRQQRCIVPPTGTSPVVSTSREVLAERDKAPTHRAGKLTSG